MERKSEALKWPLEDQINALLYDVLIEKQALECRTIFTSHAERCIELQSLCDLITGPNDILSLYEEPLRIHSVAPSDAEALRQARYVQRSVDRIFAEERGKLDRDEIVDCLRNVERALREALRVFKRHRHQRSPVCSCIGATTRLGSGDAGNKGVQCSRDVVASNLAQKLVRDLDNRLRHSSAAGIPTSYLFHRGDVDFESNSDTSQREADDSRNSGTSSSQPGAPDNNTSVADEKGVVSRKDADTQTVDVVKLNVECQTGGEEREIENVSCQTRTPGRRSIGIGSRFVNLDPSTSSASLSGSSVSLGDLLGQFRQILNTEQHLRRRSSGSQVAEPILLSPAMRRLTTARAPSLSDVSSSVANSSLDLTDGVRPLSP